MGTFKTEKMIPITLTDLSPVAKDLVEEFEKQGYETNGSQNMDGSWNVSIRKGNAFKAVLGMKSALNIKINSVPQGTYAEASVGIFGEQALPTAITLFVAWPIVITQIWGMVQQSKLDDEAIDYIERSLRVHSGQAPEASSYSGNSSYTPPQGEGTIFCSQCGAKLTPGMKFCSQCGARVE